MGNVSVMDAAERLRLLKETKGFLQDALDDYGQRFETLYSNPATAEDLPDLDKTGKLLHELVDREIALLKGRFDGINLEGGQS